jgi:hypothetical protein
VLCACFTIRDDAEWRWWNKLLSPNIGGGRTWEQLSDTCHTVEHRFFRPSWLSLWHLPTYYHCAKLIKNNYISELSIIFPTYPAIWFHCDYNCNLYLPLHSNHKISARYLHILPCTTYILVSTNTEHEANLTTFLFAMMMHYFLNEIWEQWYFYKRIK